MNKMIEIQRIYKGNTFYQRKYPISTNRMSLFMFNDYKSLHQCGKTGNLSLRIENRISLDIDSHKTDFRDDCTELGNALYLFDFLYAKYDKTENCKKV